MGESLLGGIGGVKTFVPSVRSNASERIVWRCRSPEAHAFEMTLSATDGVATFARNRDAIGIPCVGI